MTNGKRTNRTPGCTVRTADFFSPTGIREMAKWYPDNRICSGTCPLVGKDLDVRDLAWFLMVKAQPKDETRPVPDHCAHARMLPLIKRR